MSEARDRQGAAPRERRGLAGWGARGVGGLVLLVFGLAVLGTVYQGVATAVDLRHHPPPGLMVEVGNHRLHLHCLGAGSPTVVLEVDAGRSSLDWALVQPELARTTRVCAYDRAGLGWSDPGPGPRTSRRIADELHALLMRAGISGPYVLVGHALGGHHVRVFAGRYPRDVVGLVLVDPFHEDLASRVRALFPQVLRSSESLAHLRWTPTLAGLGLLRVGEGLGLVDLSDASLPPALRGIAREFALRPASWRALRGEVDAEEASEAQVREVGRALDALPLMVLAVEPGPARPSQDPRYAQLERSERELSAQLSHLSSRGRLVWVPGPGHRLPLERPAWVIDAARQVVDEARAAER
ncbi:alpha/beta hydrolase [Myxococcaceae bacterium GXIMD 01537]